MAKRRGSPDVLTSEQRACRDGDTAGLLAWAAEREAAGDADAAAALRAVPEFADHVLPHLARWRAYAADSGVSLVNQDENVAWWCEEDQIDTASNGGPNRWTDLVARLLGEWNRFHPAVEWLARRLELPRVVLEPSPDKEDTRLDRGMHLPPLRKGRRMGMVNLHPSAPDSAFCPACQGRSVYWGDRRTCAACDNRGFPNLG